MKTASPALLAYMDARRASTDASIIFADCYKITLRGGQVLAYTDADIPVVLNGIAYVANSLMISGMGYKLSLGLNVDHQSVTLLPAPGDSILGVPFLQALRTGAFDGARFARDRAFFNAWGQAPVGGINLFTGRVAAIDQIGRTSAQMTVDSGIALLDTPLPHNLYSPACVHVLFDSGCGLSKAAFSSAGSVLAGSTATLVACALAAITFQQGTLTFTSGANAGISASIKAATATTLTLGYPLPVAPAPGDTFTATQGCDHSVATCLAKFNNKANFRGFPYVPATTSSI